jgi:hypothetical protein
MATSARIHTGDNKVDDTKDDEEIYAKKILSHAQICTIHAKIPRHAHIHTGARNATHRHNVRKY